MKMYPSDLSRRIPARLLTALLLAVLAALDVLEILELGVAQGSLAFAAAAVAMLAAAPYFLGREGRTLRFFRKMVIVSLFLELTLFQLPSYNLIAGDYPKTTLLPGTAEITGGSCTLFAEEQSAAVFGTEQVVLTYSQLDIPVGTVLLNVSFNDSSEQVLVKMDVSDETTSVPRENIASAKIVKDAESSRYISCQFSGNVSQMRLKFSCPRDTDSVVIHGIYLNEPIPFQISAVRFAVLTLLTTFCYGVAVSGFLKKPFWQTEGFTTGAVLAVTAGAVILASAMILTGVPDGEFSDRWQQTYGDQVTQELVDAFSLKQTHLLTEPSPELLALENPYDFYARRAAKVSFQWDHLLYEGKYYSYYGIAPVLTLFLPYYLLTGYYFATDMAVWIFGCLGLIFLGMTYLAVSKRWFRETPAGCLIAGYVILAASCGIWYSVGRPLFYEIAISAGFMYLAMSAYFLISANILSPGKISRIRTILCSLCLGLAVLSRPTLAVYAICALVYLILSVKRSSDTLSGRIFYVLCAGVPVGLLGLLQMWYNYARFGSPLDFGIQYSLTINDFTHAEFHLIFVLIPLYRFLLAPPNISPNYPFIYTAYTKLDANGFFFQDEGSTSGIFFLALPTLGYLLSGRALRRLPDRKTRLYYAAVVGLPCVIMPLVIICSVWESGYAVRYTADFSWQMIIGALAILFWLYRNSANETKKNLFRGFMGVSAGLSILLNAVQIAAFSFSDSEYGDIQRAMYDIIAFWN